MITPAVVVIILLVSIIASSANVLADYDTKQQASSEEDADPDPSGTVEVVDENGLIYKAAGQDRYDEIASMHMTYSETRLMKLENMKTLAIADEESAPLLGAGLSADTAEEVEPASDSTPTDTETHSTYNSAFDIEVSESEYETMLRIVEAEATGEDIIGRIMVANVVLNRVEYADFPNSIEEVVMQKINGRYQFSPLYDGRYYTVKISERTIEAVNRALEGEDHSEGALYFVMRRLASESGLSWFDRNLTFIKKHGSHEFFR